MTEGSHPPACDSCRPDKSLGFDFSFAFQPIVDVHAGQVFAHEALVRGAGGEPAPEVLGRVGDDKLYRFDQLCRVKAVQLAARLGLQANLSINFLPNAVYRAETCIRTTLAAAAKAGIAMERIVFEITEGEHIVDRAHLLSIVHEYQRLGFKTAMDDFGAGYSRLDLLADYHPDYIKLDMGLVRGIHEHGTKQSIVRAVLGLCSELGIAVIAEGVETCDEARFLHDAGVHLFQGYFFARPAFERLMSVPPRRLKLA